MSRWPPRPPGGTRATAATWPSCAMTTPAPARTPAPACWTSTRAPTRPEPGWPAGTSSAWPPRAASPTRSPAGPADPRTRWPPSLPAWGRRHLHGVRHPDRCPHPGRHVVPGAPGTGRRHLSPPPTGGHLPPQRPPIRPRRSRPRPRTPQPTAPRRAPPASAPVHPFRGGRDAVPEPEGARVHALADRLIGGQQLQDRAVAVGGHRDEPFPGRLEPADDDAGAPAVAPVPDGEGLDGRPAVGVVGLGRRRGGVELGLDRRAAVGAPRRGGGGVDADRVLAEHAAVGADEPEGARCRPDAVHDLGDAVHRVVVARAAEERQAAGRGEAPWVV